MLDACYPDAYYVEGLCVDYRKGGRRVPALRDVSLCMPRGMITAVIGMSGSGKTTLARALLSRPNPSRPNSQAMVQVREWRLPARIGFVPQEAHASLHPTVPVGVQVSDVLAARHGKDVAPRSGTLALFDEVGLRPAEAFYGRLAHTLSGGEAQRVACARAVAMDAELLIADEPTSNLDLATRTGVIRLIDRITRAKRMATLLITHDLGLVAAWADRAVVLKEGEVVEAAAVSELWERPAHPYTRRLLEAFDAQCLKSNR